MAIVEQSDLKHELVIDPNLRIIRWYRWLYGKNAKLDFCHLFWGTLFSIIPAIALAVGLPIIWPSLRLARIVKRHIDRRLMARAQRKYEQEWERRRQEAKRLAEAEAFNRRLMERLANSNPSNPSFRRRVVKRIPKPKASVDVTPVSAPMIRFMGRAYRVSKRTGRRARIRTQRLMLKGLDRFADFMVKAILRLQQLGPILRPVRIGFRYIGMGLGYLFRTVFWILKWLTLGLVASVIVWALTLTSWATWAHMLLGIVIGITALGVVIETISFSILAKRKVQRHLAQAPPLRDARLPLKAMTPMRKVWFLAPRPRAGQQFVSLVGRVVVPVMDTVGRYVLLPFAKVVYILLFHPLVLLLEFLILRVIFPPVKMSGRAIIYSPTTSWTLFKRGYRAVKTNTCPRIVLESEQRKVR